MTRRVGLNVLAVATIIIVYTTLGILFTLIMPELSPIDAGGASPVSLRILGVSFLFGYLVLILYIVVGYYMTYRPLFKKPFVITYWIFFAFYITLYVNNTLLPNTGKWTSFQSYYINYFGLYNAFFVQFNLDISYGFTRFGIMQICGAVYLILAYSIGRIKI